MSKVRLEFLSWLAETLEAELAGNSVVLEQEIRDDDTVRAILTKLATKYNRFGQRVFDIRGQKLSGMVCILYNGRHLELANGLETRLNDKDVLVFVPVIQGG